MARIRSMRGDDLAELLLEAASAHGFQRHDLVGAETASSLLTMVGGSPEDFGLDEPHP